MEKIGEQVTGLDNKNNKLDKAVRLLEDNFKQLEDDSTEVQSRDGWAPVGPPEFLKS